MVGALPLVATAVLALAANGAQPGGRGVVVGGLGVERRGVGGSDYLQPFNHHTVLQTPTDRREQAEDTGDGNSGSVQRTGSFGSAH